MKMVEVVVIKVVEVVVISVWVVFGSLYATLVVVFPFGDGGMTSLLSRGDGDTRIILRWVSD